MADGVRPALGLSIGSTNLAAVTADNALTRKPVLTLYRERPPEVGVPPENPKLNAPGAVLTDFVDRVGDPYGVVAGDGSLHRSEALIADALRALAYAVTGGGALPDSVAVSYPAHWESAAVDAVGGALSRVSEWSNRARPLVLIPDAAAALFAVRANPGIPAGGTVAVCDFGGTGTSITLMDPAGDYRALAPTVRYADFSGNLIDQALLTAVMGNLPSTGTFDPATTLARGSLGRLRGECRAAKEQLSSSTMTMLADELPGVHGDFRLTRGELDEVIRESLERFVSVLQETLGRNGIGDLSGIVAVGGGANIPAVTTTLSARLRVPVITVARPQLTPAVGAALRAASHPGDAATMAGPAAAAPATAPAPHAEAGATAAAEALAWPRRAAPRPMPGALPVLPAPARETAARPAVQPDQPVQPLEETPDVEAPPKTRWYRRLPTVAAIGVALAFLLAGVAAAFAVHSTNRPSTAPPSPATTTTAPMTTPAPSPASPTPTQEAPPPSTPETTAPATPPASIEPPSTTVPPAAPQAGPPVVAAPPVPALPRIPALPQLPPIPGINEPIPGLERLNQILQEFGRIAR